MRIVLRTDSIIHRRRCSILVMFSCHVVVFVLGIYLHGLLTLVVSTVEINGSHVYVGGFMVFRYKIFLLYVVLEWESDPL